MHVHPIWPLSLCEERPLKPRKRIKANQGLAEREKEEASSVIWQMRMIIGADERRKERMRKNNHADRYWLSLMFLLASKDWAAADPHYHPMEDAIAGKDVHRACRRSGAALLCRLEDLDESDLDRLDPCLCSHLIYTSEMSASVPESWRSYSPELKFLLATPLVRWMGARPDFSELMSEVREGHFDGVDINVGEEAGGTEALNTLQKLGELLNSDKRIISLTSSDTDNFSEQIFTQTDPAHFTFITDFGKTDSKKGLTIPGSKFLFGISVTDMWKDDIAEDKVSERCAGISSLKIDEESEPKNKMKSIINKILHSVKDGKIGGIYIRSLANDDTTGACGTGSFPTLRFIRNKLNHDREPFGNFADLDIMLSTGESREVQFVLDLDSPKEELKKLPCERVGFYRHPMDCTKFYHCSEYRASTTRFNQSGPYAGFLYKCPNGLVYDERQGSCIWPSWSDPCRGSGELLPVPAKKFSCFTPGFHVDPDNCRYFYYCSDLGDSQLEAFEFLCPSDLLGFDEKKLLCNWKWTVPECNSNNKEGEANEFSHKQEKSPLRYRTSKALSLQYIPSLPFFNPFSESLGGKIMTKNETLSKSNVSFYDKNQSVVLKNSTTNTFHTVPVSNNFISNKKIDFDSKNDVKIGTAVWQRYSTDTKKNENNRNSTFNHIYSYPNSLDLNRDYLTENNDTESEKPFKGRVIKLDLNRRISENSDSEIWDAKKNKEMPRQMAPGFNLQDFKLENEHEKNYVIFENAANDDPDILSNQKPSPFMNVKCSKLLNKNREQEDVNTLGCTGEVSLTVKLNKRKDSNKYTLREDQITRSYQESQRISDLKIPVERNITNDVTQKQDRAYKLEQKSVVYPLLENKTKSMFIESPKNIPKSDSILSVPSKMQAQSKDYTAIKRTDSTRIKYTQNSSQIPLKTKLPLNYGTDEENFNENRSLADKEQKIANADRKELERNQVVKSDSMPIHFYPQGVLLNINLAHVNQIPPDVLLEVDYMLKKYMDDGRIDPNLLGEKLNASVETMTPEQHRITEPEEITDMIRIIENIISPLDIQDVQEPTVTETTYFQNSKTDSVSPASLQIQREINTTQAMKISDKNAVPEYLQDQEELKNQTKYSNPQNIPVNAVQNVTKMRPFGRGRLLRKFKYPSIREQLDQQVRYQASNPKDTSKIITNDESSTYSLPPYTYPLRISQHSDKAIRTSFTRLPIHHVSMPTSNDNAIQTSVSPFKDRLKNAAHQENQYGTPVVENQKIQQARYFQQRKSSVVDHGSPIAEQNKNDQQQLYSKQEDQSLVVDHNLQNKNLQQGGQITFVDPGLPGTKQNKNDQPVLYLRQEDQRSVVDHGLPISVQSKSYIQNQYSQHQGHISFVDYGLRVSVQDNNDQQNLFLQHRGQSSFSEHSSPDTKQNKDQASDQYFQHRSQSTVVDHGEHQYFRSEGQMSFVDHGLPVKVQDKNDRQGRYLQREDQVKAEGNKPLQEDRVDINSGAWRIYTDPEPAEMITSKIKESVAHFDSHRSENSPRRSDEIRRNREETNAYKTEQYETYTQTYTDFTKTKNNAYASFLEDSHSITENKKDYGSRQNTPPFANFENVDLSTNDDAGNAKNSFASRSQKIDQFNRPHFSDGGKSTSFSYERNGEFQENQKQRSNDDGKSRVNARNKQTKKRKKLRILVKKIEDDDSKSPTDDDKREIEERISKNLLKSLKSRLLQNRADNIELQIQYQNHVWNIPFVNNESDLSPTICTRPGLFQHPRDCNMFYECFWDKWLTRFTLHVFACPVRLVYDHTVRGCSRPSADSPCNNHTS